MVSRGKTPSIQLLDLPIELLLVGPDRGRDASTRFPGRSLISECPLPTPYEILQNTQLDPFDPKKGPDDRQKRSNHPVGPDKLVGETPSSLPWRLICQNTPVDLLYFFKDLSIRVCNRDPRLVVHPCGTRAFPPGDHEGSFSIDETGEVLWGRRSEPRVGPLMFRRLRRLWNSSRKLSSFLDIGRRRPLESRVLRQFRTCSWNSSNAATWFDLILR